MRVLGNIGLLLHVARHYGVPPARIARRAVYLYRQHNFGFQDAMKCGLLDPDPPDAAASHALQAVQDTIKTFLVMKSSEKKQPALTLGLRVFFQKLKSEVAFIGLELAPRGKRSAANIASRSSSARGGPPRLVLRL